MSATLRLPRVLTDVVNIDPIHRVEGENLSAVLANLIAANPGLRHHIFDEGGVIRPHVSVFVDGQQADLDTPISASAEIRVLQAVSGG